MHYRRVIIPGATYFFTVNLHDRKSTLLTKEMAKLRTAFRKTLQHYPCSIHGIVILPDHLHMIMALPEGDSNYAIRLNLIKGAFSKQIQPNEKVSLARAKKRERGIWQRRFWEHLIRDESDYEQHMNYIHYNPVKHGYVTNPIDWPYSSIHKHIRDGILTHAWACDDSLNKERFGE